MLWEGRQCRAPTKLAGKYGSKAQRSSEQFVGRGRDLDLFDVDVIFTSALSTSAVPAIVVPGAILGKLSRPIVLSIRVKLIHKQREECVPV